MGHLLPRAPHLQGAILQSGGPGAAWARFNPSDSGARSQALALALGCAGMGSLVCLRQRTAHQIVEAQEQVLFLYYIPPSLNHFLLVPLPPSSLGVFWSDSLLLPAHHRRGHCPLSDQSGQHLLHCSHPHLPLGHGRFGVEIPII